MTDSVDLAMYLFVDIIFFHLNHKFLKIFIDV